MNSRDGPYSRLCKLYGDPDQYVYKFENDTFERRLPILLHGVQATTYDVAHSVSIDCHTQIVYYGSNANEELRYGQYLRTGVPQYHTYSIPQTNQVTTT